MDANFVGQGGEAQRLWMFSAMAGGKPDRTTVQNISLPVYDPPTKGSRPDNWDLSKLFDQLTVECSGQLVHPQWKHFRHMTLVGSERTRLSNAIWRSWHIQMIRNRRPLYCSFNVVPPGMDNSHKRPQAVVLEGKYWRRRMEAVASEYRKFRVWHVNFKKNKAVEGRQPGVMDVSLPSSSGAPLGGLWQGFTDTFLHPPQDIYSQGMDLTSMFQPSLNMLNPALEDILNKLEPMEALFPGPSFNENPPNLPPPLDFPPDRRSPPTLLSSGSSPVGMQLNQFSEGVFKIPPPPEMNRLPSRCMDEDTLMSISPQGYVDKHLSGDLPSVKQEPGVGPLPMQIPFTFQGDKEINLDPVLHHHHHHQQQQQQQQQQQPQQQHSDNQQSMLTDPSQFRPRVNVGSRSYSAPNMILPPGPDTETASRPFGDALYDEKAQLHKSISSIQKMEQANIQQIREMERQKQEVQQEMQRLLNEYLVSSSKNTSLHQQQLLQSVASDPAILSILQTVMLQAQTVQQGPPVGVSPAGVPPVGVSPAGVPPVGMSPAGVPRASSTPLSPPLYSSTQQFLSPPPSMTPPPSVVDKKPERKSSLENDSPSIGESSDSTLLSMLSTPTQVDTPNPSVAFSPFDSPTLTLKNRSLKDLTPGEQEQYKEFRRRSHISAEQKRRGNIKNGFDRLQSFVAHLSPPSSTKLSKASVLLKSIEYTQYMQKERANQENEIEALKKRISELNVAISTYQEQLPVSGAPVTSHKFEENKRKFQEYIYTRTLLNYKFWLFGVIIRQLFESYNVSVSVSSSQEFYRTVLSWLDQNCSLPQLRRIGMQGLREISSETCILTDPVKVPHQITEMVARQQHFGSR